MCRREQFAINGSTARSRVDSIIVESVTEKRDEIRIHPRTESFLLFARRLFMRGRCARARSSVSLATPSACGRTRDAYREVACGRTVSRLCAQLYVRIRMEIRKEAGHEQWLAALRNNVVFVGSFYLPRQECTVRFKIHALATGCAIRSNRSFLLLRFGLNYRR